MSFVAALLSNKEQGTAGGSQSNLEMWPQRPSKRINFWKNSFSLERGKLAEIKMF